MRIMQITTVMAVIMIVWCGLTIYTRGAHLPPFELKFTNDSLGWLKHFPGARTIGTLGILIAFGHSILAMSGEESLAQVNREIEAPKLKNLLRAGMVIFIYSLLLTSLVSFFAVMIIPDSVRMSNYGDDLIGGLAMFMIGPLWARIALARLRGVRRIPDPRRRGQHRDRRFDRRADPRRGRRRAARLVPPSAQEIRHQLSHREHGRDAANRHHRALARRHVRAGRGLRVRRHLEFRFQNAVGADPALQGQVPSHVADAAQPEVVPPRRQGFSAGPRADVYGFVRDRDHQPVHQAGRDHLGHQLHARAVRDFRDFGKNQRHRPQHAYGEEPEKFNLRTDRGKPGRFDRSRPVRARKRN